MSNVLTAIVNADGRSFTKTLSQLEAQLKAFQNGLKNAGSVESFQRLTRAVEATQSRINALKSVGNPLRPIVGGANEAQQSLINLGRVVQDAPFGFLGIANNLNPLIEGFGRTSKAAGGFGGAMKAVGSQLLGAGGLSLGISLVSSALILFGDKLFGGSKQANALNESLKGLSSQFADEATKLTALVGVIKNQNTSRQDQKNAIQALNEQYGPYLKNLGIEEVGVGNVTKAYDALIESLLKQAVVKGLQEQISQQVEETAKKIISLQIEQENQSARAASASKKRLTDEQQKRLNLTRSLQMQNGVVRDGVLAQAQANNEQAASIAQTTTFEARIGRLTGKLKEQLAPLLNLTNQFEDLGIKLSDTKKGDKFFDDTLKKAKELDEFFSKTAFPVHFDFDPTASKDEILKKALDFIRTALASPAIAFRENIPVSLGLKLDIDRRILTDEVANKVPETFEQVRKEFVKNFEGLAAAKLLDLNLRLNIKISQEFEAKLKAQLDSINGVIKDSFAGAFEAIGEDLGNLLSGKDITGGIIDVLATALQQIGKILIVYGGIKARIDALLKSLKISGPLAIGLGIAAIAAGQLIKSLSRNVAGFRALGGPVVAGKDYIVGERGPELFRAPGNGSIVPNSALRSSGSWMGGMKLTGTLTNVLRGKDILQVLTLEQLSQGRTT